MQFSFLTVLTLATAVMGAAIRRQENKPTVSTPAMTDANGNIVPFDTKGVTQPNKAAGI